MKILIIHNYYRLRGGEDIVFEMEKDMLLKNSHDILIYTKNSSDINLKKQGLKFMYNFIYNNDTKLELEKIIIDFKPDIAHIHNIFPGISYSVYDVLKKYNIPIVQTLHNYRYFCPNGTFMNNNKVCEMCIDKGIISCIKNKCYKNSIIQSILMSKFTTSFDKYDVKDKVDAFITLTNFGKDKFTQLGMNNNKIFVKPNFIKNEISNKLYDNRNGFVFVGRLDESKGVMILLNTFKNIKYNKLKIIGEGPLEKQIKEFIKDNKMDNVELKGFLPIEEILNEIRNAKCLIMPSIWYETFGRTIIEAFSCGVPVIASNIGAMKDLIIDDYNGYLFNVGDQIDLYNKINLFIDNEELSIKLGKNAYKEYVNKYSEKTNYNMLMDIYENVLSTRD